MEVEGEKTKGTEIIQNPGFSAGSGAGVQAAQAVVNRGCNVVIAGAIGPNAFQVLSMAKLDVEECPEITVQKAIEEYLLGKLKHLSGNGRDSGKGGHGRDKGEEGRGPRSW